MTARTRGAAQLAAPGVRVTEVSEPQLDAITDATELVPAAI